MPLSPKYNWALCTCAACCLPFLWILVGLFQPSPTEDSRHLAR